MTRRIFLSCRIHIVSEHKTKVHSEIRFLGGQEEGECECKHWGTDERDLESSINLFQSFGNSRISYVYCACQS